MHNTKNTLFISHANPDDNYFASWLSAKLKLLGYQVWVDIKDIIAGDSFWPNIERIIRYETIRFIPVGSRAYVQKATIANSGVRKEIACANTVRDIPNFIMPVRIDDTAWDHLPIDILGLDGVDFYQKWGQGLEKLVRLLNEQQIPRLSNEQNVVQFWFESLQIRNSIQQRNEQYYTNWFPITLPERIWVHKLGTNLVTSELEKQTDIVKVADRIITFAPLDRIRKFVHSVSSKSFESKQFACRDDIIVDEEFVLRSPNRKLVQLLNSILKGYQINAGLKLYNQSGKKEVFYFPYSDENAKFINLSRYQKTRRILVGACKDFKWHFGISHSATLYPFPCYKISYHLIFTDPQGQLLGTDDQHELRRSFPNDWFNRDWFEILLAMILKIAQNTEKKHLEICVGDGQYVKMDLLPTSIESKIGYLEPE